MMRFLLVAAMFTVATSSMTMNNTYLITVPKTMRPGIPLDITVSILWASGDVYVRADLIKGSGDQYDTISSSNGTFQQGVPGHITLDIPHLQLAQYGPLYYYLQVYGIGGLVFEDQTTLTYQQKSMSIFVQTEKVDYKPGETVNFRVFCLQPNMSIYTGPMDIWVSDPNANKIEQFLGAQNEDGVVTRAIVIDMHPLLGHWKINVTIPGSTTAKTFQISEYVLQKFEVSLDLPPYLLTSDDYVIGTIRAKYTSGQPVKGKAVIRANLNYYYKPWSINGDEPMEELMIHIDGETQFTLPLTQLQQIEPYSYCPLVELINNYELTIDVQVTETMHNMTVNATDSTTFYTQPIKIEFLSTNDRKFKPGLPYKAKLQLSSQDGRLISASKHNVKITTFIRYEVKHTYDDYYTHKALKLSEAMYPVPLSGLLQIPVVNTFINATAIHIKAEYGELSITMDLQAYIGNSMDVVMKTHNLQLGQEAVLEVLTTEAVSTLLYQVMGREFAVTQGRVDAGGRMNTNITFPVTTQMTPSATIVVYYLSENKVISGKVKFDVGGLLQNKVSVSFDKVEAEPGDIISLTISADPLSIVNLLAVDQSVPKQGFGNDVTLADVLAEMDSYNTAIASYYCQHNSYYETSPQIFESTGLMVITDISTFIQRQFDCASIDHMDAGMSAQSGRMEDATSLVLQTVKRTHTLFPETWLWINTTTGADGRATLRITAPDIIKSWVVTAFALNKNSGLGITGSSAELTTFRPFFINLNLPYSVICGEHIVIQANVFNYMTTPLKVVVTLEKSDNYQNILIDSSGTEQLQYVSEEQTQTISVAVGEAKSVFFPVVMTTVGKIDIAVKAQSPISTDGIHSKLLVKPEGVEKDYTVHVLVDLVHMNNFNQTIELDLPANIVQGSQKAILSAIGDYIGPTLSNLDRLLDMSYGCGEQTMITFAPNVFVADYLKATNQLTPALLEKIIGYLQKGYQRELNYRHRDGSFSSFGERHCQGKRDTHSSTWLTAFAVKSFDQAMHYITIDDSIIPSALKWLLQQQRPDGSFQESGIVHSQYLKGGNSDDATLTAFVLVAILEKNHTEVDLGQEMQLSITNAVSFIESRIGNMKDQYALAISTYALKLAASPLYAASLDKLSAQVITEGDLKHWHKQSPQPVHYWSPSNKQSRPIDIEITSYALLTYADLRDYVNGLPILKWILNQRNNYGGFASTQDTMLALQAMSECAKMGFLASSADYQNINMQVSITATNMDHQISITPRNALVLQTYQPKTIPSAVTIQATGTGLAFVQVGVSFNVERQLIEPSFEVTVSIELETINKIIIQTCTRYIRAGSSGMAIVELGIPSGFDADEKSITDATEVKKIEAKAQKLVLYFDQIAASHVCMTMEATRVSMVAKAKQVPIQVYSYYQPTDQVMTFYLPQLLRDSNICDVCSECSCTAVKQLVTMDPLEENMLL